MNTRTERRIWGVLLLASVLALISSSASAECVRSHAERGWYCFNGIDDNCNLLTDGQDTLGCSCMDGKDNNVGGGTDCADLDCKSEIYCGSTENIIYCDENGQNCKNGCSDTLSNGTAFDNDGDGLANCDDTVDCDCSSSSTTSSTSSSDSSSSTSSTTSSDSSSTTSSVTSSTTSSDSSSSTSSDSSSTTSSDSSSTTSSDSSSTSSSTSSSSSSLPAFHSVCVYNGGWRCEQVEGAGVDQCTSSTDCYTRPSNYSCYNSIQPDVYASVTDICSGKECPAGEGCTAVFWAVEGSGDLGAETIGDCACEATTTTTITSSTTTTTQGGGGPPSGPSTPLGPSSEVRATCFDGVQNRDETGIDCGGTFCNPCIKPTTTLSAPPTTQPAQESFVTTTTLKQIVQAEGVGAVTTTTLMSGMPTGYFLFPVEMAKDEMNWSLSLFLIMSLIGLYFYRTMDAGSGLDQKSGSKKK